MAYRNPDETRFDDLIAAIEAVRVQRMDQYRRDHPGGKRFTQQELNDTTCSTYKNYLDGRSRRLPSRRTLLDIAEYLECSTAEQNHLLRLAGYLPEPPRRSSVDLEPVLMRGRKLMRDLQFPSLLLTRDYRVHTVCPNFTTLFGTPHIDDIPDNQRTLLDLLHCPTLTPHITDSSRQALLGTLLYHLKYRTQTAEMTPEYTNLRGMIENSNQLRRVWRGLRVDAPARQNRSGSVRWGDEDICFNIITTPVDAEKFVTILSLLPADDRARAVFSETGCENTPLQAGVCLQWERDYMTLTRAS